LGVLVPTYAGPRWSDGRAQGDAFVRVERGRIVEEGSGVPPGAHPAVLLDGVHNYHTHVGDAFLQGHDLPRSLPALVKPGTGYKHQMLATMPRATILRGMTTALSAYEAAGTRSILDFREQGVAGVKLVRSVARGPRPSPVVRVLGRPVRPAPDTDEFQALLDEGDGIGISSVADVDEGMVEQASRACKRARKPFALHVSEQRRDPMERVLSYEPQLVIHLCQATPADLRLLAKTDVAVAVCPSSNAFFRMRSPIAQLVRARIPFYFGTDNAMFGQFDVIGEVVRARKWAPRVPDDEFLRALTTPVEKAIKRAQPVPSLAGVPERVVVLPRRRSRIVWGSRPLVAAR
jgi:cytosine/adenosine deaminase-related metal-dependent hydrolase